MAWTPREVLSRAQTGAAASFGNFGRADGLRPWGRVHHLNALASPSNAARPSETIPTVDANALIQTVAVYALPVLFAITLHEAAHGYAARRFGDMTATVMGRVTLNPLVHIDLMGTVLMPLLLYFATAGSFLFVYAKPVPVDFSRLRHPKRDMVWVALAGPAANFIQAIFWGVALVLITGSGVEERFFVELCKAGVRVNLVMWAFNLFPLPPLDGGRILVGLLPLPAARALSRIERWGIFIVLGLVVAGVVGKLWLNPLLNLGYEALGLLLSPLDHFFR